MSSTNSFRMVYNNIFSELAPITEFLALLTSPMSNNLAGIKLAASNQLSLKLSKIISLSFGT